MTESFPSNEDFAGVLVAAGRGTRYGGSTPKQFLELDGKSVWRHGLDLLFSYPGTGRAVVVVEAGETGRIEMEIASVPARGDVRVVEGGATRQESVHRGLEALSADPPGWVLIHDAARPWASPELVRRVAESAIEVGAVVPGLPVRDTMLRMDAGRVLVEVLPRDFCVAVQTPQAFRYAAIVQAHAEGRGRNATDDGSLFWEVLGRQVHVVPGEPGNRKLTTPDDWPD